jgi:two-component system chemotaxis response regulator CheB
MPISVLESMDVDYVESLSNMGTLLSEIIADNNPTPVEVPFDIIQETNIDKRVSTSVDDLAPFEKARFNCPDCGGGLYITQNENPTHYRCHVWSLVYRKDLLNRISEVMENTIWTALRMMEERRALLLRLANRDQQRGYRSTANLHSVKAKELEQHIDNLKQILFATSEPE